MPINKSVMYNEMDYARHRMHSTFQNLKKAYNYVCGDIKGSYSCKVGTLYR